MPPLAMSYEPQSGIEAAGETQADDAPEKREKGNKLTEEELAELIGPWFNSLRPLAYETKKGVQSNIIIANRDLIHAIANKVENLSLNELQTNKAMKILADKNNEKWQVGNAQLENWALAMSEKLRIVLRDTQQTRIKTKPPPWVADLDLPIWGRRRQPSGEVLNVEDLTEESHPQDVENAGDLGTVEEKHMRATGYDDGKAWRQQVFKGTY